MNTLISGGCKNGKSYYAQELAKDRATAAGVPLYYLATMDPRDEEDRLRIARHIEERAGWGFVTIEEPYRISNCLSVVETKGIFLLDSVTALLANVMFGKGRNESAVEEVAEDLLFFAEKTGGTIFVSDFIYGDGVAYDASTEAYRKGL
ncbi:MAG: bifunctional adenosylcobinamide kinase/adenosylcobinamide-phosphate guanylyltransferase, partial [Anaerovoracaceae bacterium]